MAEPIRPDLAFLRQRCSDELTSHRDTRPHPDIRRSSIFLETGLDGEDAILDAKIKGASRTKMQVRFKNEVEVVEPAEWSKDSAEQFQYAQRRPQPEAYPYFPTLPRLLFLAFVIALLVPSLKKDLSLGIDFSSIGAVAGVVRTPIPKQPPALPAQVEKRQNSPTDVCKRWAAQSALVNGTLYYYGGRATTSGSQTTNEWNNDFLTLDLTKTWNIGSPTLQGLPQPSGPPPVSEGFLWNSYDALYLYGGEFSDSPATSPVPFGTWEYSIASSSWTEFSNPTDAATGGAILRAAEGAGVSVPNLGRGYYFGGHLDGYTVPDWSQSVARVYLSSLLEYVFPGYSDASVNNGQTAGSSGQYNNITSGGLQGGASFPERADGALVYIPGYGKQGIIVGLAGGTNASFAELNVLDVYDVAAGEWYKQATSGPTPEIRVDPCTVAVASEDASSTQIYMYGGQNLVPYAEQTQYGDIWILTVPSFTWIEVNQDGQSTPPPRAGHSCNVWNSQMVVVGGYVGQDILCDTGFYVFNLSSLAWQNQYTALDTKDPLNRQTPQQDDPNALQGSFGYNVPPLVRSAIGGNAVGSATVTAPAIQATQGPLVSGSPKTYTISGSAVTVIPTSTSVPTTSPGGNTGSGAGNESGNTPGPNIGAIVAGVIAGLLAVAVAYLGFCTWLYRKQLRIYKNHVAMSQRAQLSGDPRFAGAGLIGGRASDKDKSQGSNEAGSSRYSNERGGTPPSSRGGGSANNRWASNNPYLNYVSTASSSTEDISLQGQEPSFLGVVLNPRRSLRVVNRD